MHMMTHLQEKNQCVAPGSLSAFPVSPFVAMTLNLQIVMQKGIINLLIQTVSLFCPLTFSKLIPVELLWTSLSHCFPIVS